MVGGFLGAGKTTALAQLGERFQRAGWRVGLITNDQGQDLVDTAFLKARGFPTREIAGGCFCCRFDSLMEAAERLSEEARPDIFLAEPVGSCTDLVATVTYPLSRMYGERFSIAPLSVLVDPIRALRILELEPGANFSPKVRYIYGKQLEEADCLVVNKIDLLESGRRKRLRAALRERHPEAAIFEICARSGEGMDDWFNHLNRADQQPRKVMEVSYETYAAGEALLAWLNATVEVSSEVPFDPNELLEQMSLAMQREIEIQGGEIAHLKMTLTPPGELGGIAVINLTRSGMVPELSETLEGELGAGELIINLRAETSPEALKGALEKAVANCRGAGRRMELKHLQNFRPGKPVPTHRVAD